MNDLRARVERSLRDLGVPEEDPIGVACSGGADSIALVHLLAPRDVAVLHVDHGLRDDSSADAEFVARTAQQLGLRYGGRRVAINRAPDGVEAAARDARYEALEEMAHELGLRHVLTAHTTDDQAETVLMRLMRGGSLEGIAPARGILRRPLLGVRGEELRAWLSSQDIAWREDPSNEDRHHERNWIRHVLMPQLTARRPGLAKVLARKAARTREDDHLLEALASNVIERAPIDDVGLLVRDFDVLPPAIASRVIRLACRRFGDDPSDAELDAVRTIKEHIRCGAVDVWRLDDGLAFVRSPVPVPDTVTLPPSGELTLDDWGIKVRIESDAVPGLRIRSRRPGDRVRARVGTRKVQDVLVDAKVPRALRPLVPILADARNALAVIGGRTERLDSSSVAAVVQAEPYNQSWSRRRAWIR